MPQSTPIRITTPRLYNGMSRQPEHQRLDNQVEDAANATFDVVDGVSKRPGTTLLRTINVSTAATFRLHPITRDHDEEYLVLVGDFGALRVFELPSGLEATVNITTDAQQYLNAGDGAPDRFRMTTIKDYTIIVNTDVATAASPAGDGTTSITASRMPIQMVRTSYTGDGSTPAVFDVSAITWNARASGDATSNPTPELIDVAGAKISDVALHRNRLVLTGEDYVLFSQAGDLFNLYIEDVANLVESDPIQLQLGGNEVSIIDFIVPFNKSLLIFTKAGQQYELNAPESLTPSTAAVTTTTSYKTMEVRPVLMGSFVYFMGWNAEGGQLYEYYYDESVISNTAANVSNHIPGLLPAQVRDLVASTNTQTLVVVPAGCKSVYVYRTHFTADEKAQSAWSYWTFDPNYDINDGCVIRDTLYLLVNDSTQVAVESVPIHKHITLDN